MMELHNRKMRIEEEIAKLQEELQVVNAEIEAKITEAKAIKEAAEAEQRANIKNDRVNFFKAQATLQTYIKRVEKYSIQYGVCVEDMKVTIYETIDRKDHARLKMEWLENHVEFIGGTANLTISESGRIELHNKDGFLVREYKKLGAAVKAMDNVPEIQFEY